MASEKHFWHRLESLRGFFALTVAVHHALLIIQGQGRAEQLMRGAHNIFYGQGAVLSFFILSGLVLGQSLRRSGGKALWTFYMRRFLRIYPALVASLVFACILISLFGFGTFSNAAATDYFGRLYREPLSCSLFVDNVLLRNYALNNVTWTLCVEIIGSAFLPLMHLLSRGPVQRLGLMSGLVILSLIPAGQGLNGSLAYLWVFYLGYLIPLAGGKISGVLSRRKATLTAGLLCALAVCWSTLHFGHHFIPYVLAMGLIITCVYQLPEAPHFAFLDNGVMRFYGRISYSFYVLNFLVLYAIALLVFRLYPARLLVDNALLATFVLTAVSIAATTAVAWLSFLFVEKPFIRLGQKWCEPKP